MEKIKSILKEDISKLPEESGVYIFLALRSSNE